MQAIKKFQASLVYRVSSNTAKETLRTVLKIQRGRGYTHSLSVAFPFPSSPTEYALLKPVIFLSSLSGPWKTSYPASRHFRQIDEKGRLQQPPNFHIPVERTVWSLVYFTRWWASTQVSHSGSEHSTQ